LIDTRKNIYDFIKLAACEGYIKRSTGEVEVVSGSGLPIGVLDNVSPHITKLYISNMDMIVLVSDGVSDVLGEGLKFLISTIDTINPQTMADEILQKAIDNGCGVSGDDMTVICVRVFESV
jgi:stage II sporulation protein E